MIGADKFRNFSATDIWLLLSAAYYHDVGMSLRYNDINKIFTDEKENEKFVEYIISKNEDLNEDNLSFNVVNGTNKIKTITLREENFDEKTMGSILDLLSGYFRKNHAEYSKQRIEEMYISQSEDENGITSLIPLRLFRCLGDICWAHGWDFKDIFKRLSFNELGVGDGVCCHPILIACLLRLGDLLDLDNDRINMSSIKFIGLENISKDSTFHFRKHKSIDHFSINTQEIDIHATVNIEKKDASGKDTIDEDAYNVAEVIKSWFKMIKDEIANQKAQWRSIAPKEYHISLPDVKGLRVDLDKKYLYLEESKKPEFDIDAKRTFELLKGANLYKTPWKSIRELLQNSVDASAIRLWHDHKKKVDKLEIKDFSQYVIAINIAKNKDSKFEIEIKDVGIGMTIGDLKYLLKVGSARKNLNKRKLVDGMPEWLKPSGSFGIGFQSVFMLTKQVELKTKSYTDGATLSIILFSPSEIHHGDAIIESEINEGSDISYTDIKFCLDNNENLNSQDEIVSMDIEDAIDVGKFDPFSESSDSLFLNRIIFEMEQFAESSPFPITINVENEPIYTHKKNNMPLGAGNILAININGSEEDINVSLDVNMTKSQNIYSGRTDIYYKYQYVMSSETAVYPFLDISLNILSGDADLWLNLNRNEIREERRSYIRKLIEQSLPQVLNKLVKNSNKEDLCKFSLLNKVFLYRNENVKEDSALNHLEVNYRDYDLSKIIKSNDVIKNVGKLLEECKKLILVGYVKDDDLKNRTFDKDDLSFGNGTLSIFFNLAPDMYNLKLMLVSVLRLYGQKDIDISFQMEAKNNSDCKIKLKGDSLEVSMEKDSCSNFLMHYIQKFKHEKLRYLIPCPNNFRELAIDTVKSSSFVDFFLPFDMDSICDNLMICPVCNHEEINNAKITDALVNYVFQNRKDKSVKIDDIKTKYNEFMNE
jgi:hypothetical protein